ncbi:MAG: AMIN domain-containing protein [Desulfobacula sp.]|jgi:hypothetical protein|nr:AMIN domain-containing protein [Desulfobacula sp.]
MTLEQPGKLFIIFLFTVVSALMVLPANSSAFPSNSVKNITFDKKSTQETIIVFLEKLPKIKFFVLHNPERIVVDIKNAFVPQVNINKETRGEAVKKIRVGQNKKDTARIVLDINEDSQYNFMVKKKMFNEKPAVIIMVSSLKKEKKQNLPPLPILFNPIESNAIPPETSFEKIPVKEIEGSLVLFDDAMPDDIFNKTDKQEKKSDFSISGILHVRTTFQAKENNSVENNTTIRNRILVETRYKNLLTLSALSDYLYFGKENETDAFDLDLHEAKWQYNKGNYGFSIGRQIIRWGKADQISPVDTLNPQDMREFIIPEYEERKIPLWMADLNLFFDKFTLEGVFIPFFEKSRMDYFGTDWSIFGHMKKELQNAPVPPALKTYFNNINVHEKDPDTETEFALRLATTIKSIDLGLTFHHTTEDTPYFTSFPVKNLNISNDLSIQSLTSSLSTAVLTNENIEVEYKRTSIVGFEFETVFADFGVRGEAAWQENQSFLTSSLTSIRKPTLIYIIGADYTTLGDTYLNLQFVHRHVSNYDPDILYFDQDTYSLIGEISRNIVSDWLKASLKYSNNLNNNEWYLSPQLKYTYITNFECIIGAHLFSGDKDTWLGSFQDSDLFFLDLSYQF